MHHTPNPEWLKQSLSTSALGARQLLTFRQLEAFYWAAKLGNFTRAAQRMKMTQSAVSLRIAELEQILKTQLFHRGRRGPEMTHRAHELLKFAEQILRLSAEAQETVSRLEFVPEVLRIGFAEVISYTWLSKFVDQIRAKYPNISLLLEEALVQEVYASLYRGSIDLALAAGMPPFTHKVFSIPLGSVEFAWMASPKLGLPRKTLRPSDLQEYPIICLSAQSILYSTIRDWFATGNVVPTSVFTCKSIHVAGALAKAKLGVALLPLRLYAQELKKKNLVALRVDPPIQPMQFSAFSSTNNIDPFVREIATLAAAVSDFSKA